MFITNVYKGLISMQATNLIKYEVQPIDKVFVAALQFDEPCGVVWGELLLNFKLGL